MLLEGPGDLSEGNLFDLSLLQMAEVLDAGVLLVARYKSLLSVEALLAAKGRMGDRLLGVVINDIPVTQLETVDTLLRPFWNSKGFQF